MKTYEYTDDSWWDDNGCSCCEPLLMPCYNLLDIETYSCHSEEDCYRQALEIEGVLDEGDDYDYNEVDFKQMCEARGINVVIYYDEE